MFQLYLGVVLALGINVVQGQNNLCSRIYCGPGYQCIRGECQPIGKYCLTNRDCAFYEICDRGICTPKPIQPSPKPTGQYCFSQRDCAVYEKCDRGMCTQKPTKGPYCSSKRDCRFYEDCIRGTCSFITLPQPTTTTAPFCRTKQDCKFYEDCIRRRCTTSTTGSFCRWDSSSIQDTCVGFTGSAVSSRVSVR
uniref:Uncharacterized protein LOC111123832 isoform X1 n=1 Tax=Crassostrea virginica TaxID=6565 RepID=A0A8B8D362_CRAVI|nr:uncharacterized protein LOC111123832 isoform X1 [Crassostrea virginica]